MPDRKQTWPWRHPVLASVVTVVLGLFLLAAIFGGSSSTNTATVTQTQTVTRRIRATRPHAVIRRRRAVSHTVTVTSTVTSTIIRTATTAAVPGSSSTVPASSAEGPGSTSHAQDAQFCSTHSCIQNFPNGNGYVVQCVDGEWSHSGGLSGACSDHGGET